jgi:tetratricopeptide (TPR) repeat protein
MNDWAVLIVIYGTLFISSPLIAILHELGHAFAYLVLTKPDRIDIYIGSYGSKKNAFQFEIGKICFYIKRSFPFVKGIGLCHSYKSETNYKNDIMILLAGPVFTLLVACIPGIIVFNIHVNLLIQIACYIFLGLSVLSLITNLVPREIDKSYDVNLDNDGKQIFFALKVKEALPDYVEAIQYLHKEEYIIAIEKLKNVLIIAPNSAKVLRLIIAISLIAKQYDDASLYLDKLESNFELSNDDMINKGCLLSFTNRHKEAINTYTKVLKKNRHNVIALNNIGYELIKIEDFVVAQKAFEKAIKLKPSFDDPYAGAGYLKILQGDFESGREFINKCLNINPKNVDAYKALGIYYLKLKDPNLANENFNKAFELDSDIDLGIYTDELKQLADQDIT